MKIKPTNLTAQLHHRAAGNPVSTLPSSAISNCFPGLEYDFKNFWRRSLVGIVLLEWDNYVIEIEDERYQDLLHHRLLKVDGRPIVTAVHGPVSPQVIDTGLPYGKPGVVTMEWSNALAFVRLHQGKKVRCHFTADVSNDRLGIPDDPSLLLDLELKVRPIFDEGSLAIAEGVVQPGELTQGLCSPWQHDYRECACYYWPASRPDYVNVEPTAQGGSQGDNWFSKGERTGEYALDNRRDSRLVSYDDLFRDWERELRFQVRGRDAERSS